MITFDQLTISGGGKKLIENFTYRISAGDKVVVTGPSGCGKSSLLRAIIGFHAIDAGVIELNNERDPAKFRSNIAYLSQAAIPGAELARSALLLAYTFKANRNHQPDAETIHKALRDAGLTPDVLDKRCSVLSGGELQKLCLARILLLQKPLILADEFTSALDAASRDQAVSTLLAQDSSIIAVTHDPGVAAAFPVELRYNNRTFEEVKR